MEAYEIDALARAVAAGSLVFMAELALWGLWKVRRRIAETAKWHLRRFRVTRYGKRSKTALVAILCAVAVSAALALPTQAQALTLPKGYGLSKRDAKSYTRKNMWRRIKTPKCWRTKCTVGAKRFRTMGVVRKQGRTWTWYSQRVLPGGGLKIRGRHLNRRGYVVDWKGRIVLSSDELKRGTVIRTPFGAKGIVLDCGCSGSIDVYTGW